MATLHDFKDEFKYKSWLKFIQFYSLPFTFSYNFTHSLNLLFSVSQSYTLTRMFSRHDIKQWPAVSVVPVFTPSHPFHSNLFVFFHICFRTYPNLSFWISVSNSFVFIISRNRLFLRAMTVRVVIAFGVDRFGFVDSPELFLYSCSIFSYFASKFICSMKVS